jgi:hypothetical protein
MLIDDIEEFLFYNDCYTKGNAIKLVMELDIPIENKKQIINELTINKLS